MSKQPRDLPSILTELSGLITRIQEGDPGSVGPLWGQTHKLLLKTGADPGDIAGIVMRRDLEVLRKLLHGLKGGEREAPADSAETPPASDISPEVLKRAMRAFRKRLKLTRLDHESRLGRNPLTSGRKAAIDAILPPHEFTPEVWEALVAEGQLRSMGQGFYMIVDE
jgi:hypothetical protein